MDLYWPIFGCQTCFSIPHYLISSAPISLPCGLNLNRRCAHVCGDLQLVPFVNQFRTFHILIIQRQTGFQCLSQMQEHQLVNDCSSVIQYVMDGCKVMLGIWHRCLWELQVHISFNAFFMNYWLGFSALLCSSSGGMWKAAFILR